MPFDGLYGVFSDSLPDGWGRLLVDRMLNSQNINPRKINPLSRLAIVGETGMGTLSYKPEYNLLDKKSQLQILKKSFAIGSLFL